MISVVVDRDSVAAGDDAVSHVLELRLPDDARVGDAVLWMLDNRYVFMKGVTWVVAFVRDAEVRRQNGSVSIRGGSDVPVVALVSSESEPLAWSVLPLSRGWHSRSRFAEIPLRTSSGEYAMRAQYVSNGRLVGLDAYRPQVAESDEAEAARWAEFRHRTWPQYYDENGTRRA